MVEINGTPAQKATVTAEQQDVLIGLASEDVELVVLVDSFGPPGPAGPPGHSVTAYVQAGEPVGGLYPGDIWIRKPPDGLVPQPTFIWDGTAWLAIYAVTTAT